MNNKRKHVFQAHVHSCMHTSGETTAREQIDTNLIPADWVDLYHCHYSAPQADQSWWPIPRPSLTFAGRAATAWHFPPKMSRALFRVTEHLNERRKNGQSSSLSFHGYPVNRRAIRPHATPYPSSRRSRQHPLDSRKPSPTTNTNKGHAQQVNIGLLFTAESLYCCRPYCTDVVLGNKCFLLSLTAVVVTDGFRYSFPLVAACINSCY